MLYQRKSPISQLKKRREKLNSVGADTKILNQTPFGRKALDILHTHTHPKALCTMPHAWLSDRVILPLCEGSQNQGQCRAWHSALSGAKPPLLYTLGLSEITMAQPPFHEDPFSPMLLTCVEKEFLVRLLPIPMLARGIQDRAHLRTPGPPTEDIQALRHTQFPAV